MNIHVMLYPHQQQSWTTIINNSLHISFQLWHSVMAMSQLSEYPHSLQPHLKVWLTQGHICIVLIMSIVHTDSTCLLHQLHDGIGCGGMLQLIHGNWTMPSKRSQFCHVHTWGLYIPLRARVCMEKNSGIILMEHLSNPTWTHSFLLWQMQNNMNNTGGQLAWTNEIVFSVASNTTQLCRWATTHNTVFNSKNCFSYSHLGWQGICCSIGRILLLPAQEAYHDS
jgi:hypothetical protein